LGLHSQTFSLEQNGVSQSEQPASDGEPVQRDAAPTATTPAMAAARTSTCVLFDRRDRASQTFVAINISRAGKPESPAV